MDNDEVKANNLKYDKYAIKIWITSRSQERSWFQVLGVRHNSWLPWFVVSNNWWLEFPFCFQFSGSFKDFAEEAWTFPACQQVFHVLPWLLWEISWPQYRLLPSSATHCGRDSRLARIRRCEPRCTPHEFSKVTTQELQSQTRSGVHIFWGVNVRWNWAFARKTDRFAALLVGWIIYEENKWKDNGSPPDLWLNLKSFLFLKD